MPTEILDFEEMFSIRSCVGQRDDLMVQRIQDFGEGLCKSLGIKIRCDGCGKVVVYRAQDFIGYIPYGRAIEDMRWRCGWCGVLATWIRWTQIDRNNREGLAQWMPLVKSRLQT